MTDIESKKAAIAQQIAQEESALQKTEREKKAAEEAEALLNEQNQEIDNTIAFEEEEQLIAQEEQAAQPESPALPHWVTDLLLRGAEYLYENEFGSLADGGAAASNAAENVLSNFAENNFIQGFEETLQGFKVALAGGEDIIFNLMDNKIFSNSITDKAFEVIATVVKAVGGDKLDISNQKDDDARFSAWNNAVQKGLEVAGLTTGEDEKLRQKEAMGLHKG
jgi:hypothetical protein